ncbi:MAG: hypothetical protein JSS76_03760 [Bacteroidetes bacterium]|nr:hypothetical protein [Bacteroidota bacterium]
MEIKLKSKSELLLNFGYHYTFECLDIVGKISVIEVDANNDKIAIQLANSIFSGEIRSILNNELPEEKHLLSYTHFSRKDLIYHSQGQIFGNWQSSFAGACIYTANNISLIEASIIRLTDLGNCPNGHPIVMADHY